MAGETKFTVDNIARRCLKIRVDFLDGDELDQELAMRRIFLTGDESMSRRRRSLREALKQEIEQGVIGKDLPNSPDDELRICEVKLYKLETSSFMGTHIAPKCQSTLLHLANRLLVLIEHAGEEIQIKAQELLRSVIGHLNHYYGDDERVSSSDDTPQVEEEEDGSEVLAQEENWEDEVENEVERAIGSGLPVVSTSEGTSSNTRESQVELELMNFFKRLGVSESRGMDSRAVRNLLYKVEDELSYLRLCQERTSRVNSSDSANASGNTVIGANNSLRTGQPFSNPTIAPTTCSGTIPKITHVSSRPIPSATIASTSAIYSNVSVMSGPHPGNSWFPTVSTTRSTRPPRSLAPTCVPSSIHPLYTSVSGAGLNQQGNIEDPWILPPGSRSDNAVFPPTFNSWDLPQSSRSDIPVYPPISNPNPGPWFPTVSSAVPPISTGYPFPFSGYNFPVFQAAPSSRRTIPVSQWRIEKYSGTDQGMKLNEFLGLVDQLSLSERVSEEELFDSAFHLFEGPAATWYMSLRSSGRLFNWRHLVYEIRKTFVHPELDTLVRSRIYQRRQQRNETFQEYYFDMDKMFRSMIYQMDDREKLDIVRRNLRTDYKKILLWKPVGDLPQLIDACHLIDASNFSMYQKVFGTEQSVNVVEHKNPPNQNPRSAEKFT